MRISKSICMIVIALPLVAGSVLAVARYWPADSNATIDLTSELAAMNANVPLETKARLVLGFYCASCHMSGRSGADFDEPALHLKSMREDRATWEMVVQKLRARTMPPRKYPQPLDEERADLIEWVEKEILAVEPSSKPLLARRLQRSEYLNTMRDLLGVSLNLTELFPANDAGWDYCDDLPALSRDLAKQYRLIAHRILDEALAADMASTVLEEDEVDDDDSAPPVDVARAHALFHPDMAGRSKTDGAREVLASFARRAYRRPVDAGEIDHLVAIFENADESGASFEKALSAALEEVLTSPHFLFRLEARDGMAVKPPHGDPVDTSPQRKQRSPLLALRASHSEFALASRLSFFLWSTTPDDELMNLAERGMLTKRLDKQVQRMLNDRRSQAFSRDFAAYWIGLDKLAYSDTLDESLLIAMRQETEQFTDAIVREDRNVLDFLGADFTFLNERLAKHYGIAGVHGDHMRRVSVRGTVRGGLLTQASVLNVSPATDTSPVKRGKWILENLMGAAPVRPPAGLLEAFENSPKKFGRGTVREQLITHRSNASCAQCHWKMDAVGLSLENFDSFGAWRTEVNNYAADANGVLPDGETLHGPAELKAYLLKQPKQFVRGLSEKLLAYSLGRKLDARDRAELVTIPDRVAADGYRFSRVILEVVQSEPFLTGSRGVNAR